MASVPAPEPSERDRRIGGRVVEVLLTLAAAGGALCVLAVLGAVLFGVGLTMFATGSMAPAIPAGSVAVIRDVPADQVRVGDVVTVPRPGLLPITHRVRSTGPGPDGTRILVLRGDANAEDDPEPYRVSKVGLVLFSVPGAAPVVVALSHPVTLGGLTLGAAVLVLWAFWPRRPRTSAGAAALLVVIVVLTAQLPVGVPPTFAAERERVTTGTVITLVSIGDDTAMGNLAPGVPVNWQVGVLSRPPEPGRIDVELSATGPLAARSDGLQLDVRSCPVRWRAGRCAGPGTPLLPRIPASVLADRPRRVAGFTAGQDHWLLITVQLPAGFRGSGSAGLRLTATGQGDAVSTEPRPPALPPTGASELRPVLAAGSVAVLVGVAVLGLWRRQDGSRGSERSR